MSWLIGVILVIILVICAFQNLVTGLTLFLRSFINSGIGNKFEKLYLYKSLLIIGTFFFIVGFILTIIIFHKLFLIFNNYYYLFWTIILMITIFDLLLLFKIKSDDIKKVKPAGGLYRFTWVIDFNKKFYQYYLSPYIVIWVFLFIVIIYVFLIWLLKVIRGA